MNKDFFDVIYTRRSVRQFTGEKVKREDLMTMLRAGMSAPSAVNVQPWAFVAVTERGMLDKLCDALLRKNAGQGRGGNYCLRHPR
jgi:nitroreductase